MIFSQLLSSAILQFNVAFRPETVRTIRDGESRTVTSTFTHLLSSEQCCRPSSYLNNKGLQELDDPSIDVR